MYKITKISALAIALLGSVAAPVMAQSTPVAVGCGQLNPVVCVDQVGDGNIARVSAEGRGNGAGAITSQTATGIRTLGSNAPASDIVMPSLASGVVLQQGDDNIATVDIEGQDNDFHISQRGDRNIASQVVVGSRNSVSVEQGLGTISSDNISVQVQIGSNNVLRTQQFGSGNIAVQAQVPTSGAALVALAGGGAAMMENALLEAVAGGADFNRILLEQNGDGNEAYLAQVGFGNEIALRQQGGSGITITQLGSGHSIGIEQPAGQRGVQILQY